MYPRGVQSKVRGLQVHGHTVPEATAGQRTAVNLQGVERAAIERGDVLAPAGALVPTFLLDGTLELLEDAPRPIKTRDRVRFHVGTQEVMARVLPVDRAELAPGGSCHARFRLEAPLVALPGDRFVVRSYSPIVTIGGGTSSTSRRRASSDGAPRSPPTWRCSPPASPRAVLEEHLKQAGAAGARAADLRARTPFGPQQLRRSSTSSSSVGRASSRWIASGTCIATRVTGCAPRRLALLEEFHAENPLRGGISREELRSRAGERPGAGLRPAPDPLEAEGVVKSEQDQVRLAPTPSG